MKRKHLPKLLTSVLVVLFGLSNSAFAQTPDYVNSTLFSFYPSNSFPFNTTYAPKVENLNPAGEFVNATPGMISAVYYRRATTTGSTTTYNNLKIEIYQTTATSFSGNTFSGGTVGRNSSYGVPSGSAGNWMQLPLTTPVLYDPSKSINITTEHSSRSGTGIRVYTGWDCGPGVRRRYGTTGSASAIGNDCSWYEMGIDIDPIIGTDLWTFAIPDPSNACGVASNPFSVQLLNIGQDSVFDIPVTMNITGTVGGSPYSKTIDTVYTDTLFSFQNKVITFNHTANTLAGADLNITAFAKVPNDNDASNDTITVNRKVNNIPNAPTVYDKSICGAQEVELTADAPGTGEEIFWTEESTGRYYVDEGDTANTSFLNPGNYTYYAHKGSGITRDDQTNGLSPNFIVTTSYSTPNGGMFQVDATGQSVIVDSVGAYLFLTASTDYEVYMKYDTYAGYETDPSAWRLVAKGSGVYTGGTAEIDWFQLDDPVIIRKGDKASFYVSVTNNTVYLKSGSNTTVGDVVTIESTPANSGLFSAIFTGYALNTGVKFRRYCEGNSSSAAVEVKPRPYGATITDGTPFVGIKRTGNIARPDVMADGDTINYTFTPPTNFNNADHGTTWEISSVSVTTVKGTTVANTYYDVTNPVGSTDANIQFYPDTNWADSTIEFQVLIKNLDPNNLCDSLITRYIFLAPRPVPDFEAAGQCAGDAVEFKNTSTIKSGNMRYEWDFDDGDKATVTNPIHAFDAPGTYNVKLVATNEYGYTETMIKQVTIKEKPAIDFRPINACEGTAVVFQNNTTIGSGAPISYEWTFGDGSPKDVTTSPSHLYATAGEYKVTLIATADGCVSSAAKNAFQFPQPTADFDISNDECNVTSEVVFTNKSTISSGRLGSFWDFGDLNYTTERDALHNFNSAGVHTIKLKVQSEFGCIDTVVKQITLKESPIASFDNSQTCDIDPVTFTNTSYEPTGVNVDYSWNFGDPTSNDNVSNLTNPEHKYSLPGARTVTLTVTGDNGCSDEVSKDIVIGVQPQANFVVDLSCEGEMTQFTNKTTISRGDIGITYEWDFGDGDNSTDISPEKVFSTPGTYTVTLVSTADEGGCTDTEVKDITVYDTPECDFTAETNGSGDRRYNFTINNAPVEGSSIQWKFGDGGFSTDEAPQWQYSFDGGFFVTLKIISPGGCDCQITERLNVDKSSIETLENNVSVYPNPSTGVFNVEISNINEGATVTVYNSLGQQVSTVSVDNASADVIKLDIADQPAGIYTVKVSTETQVYTTKVTLTK